MAVQFWLSPLLGDGTRLNPYRAKAQDVFRQARIAADPGVVCKFSALIPAGVIGAPREAFALCEIDLPDFSLLAADTALSLLSRRSALDATPTAATDTALTKFGLVRDGGDLTLMEVTRRVMKQLEMTADVK